MAFACTVTRKENTHQSATRPLWVPQRCCSLRIPGNQWRRRLLAIAVHIALIPDLAVPDP